MLERIPQKIDYYRYTDKGVVLDGVIKQKDLAKDLPRLSAAISAAPADIEFHLEFDVDSSSNRIVTGWAKTRVMLQCQTCMKDYEDDLRADISIAFAKNEFESKRAEISKYDIFFVGGQFGNDIDDKQSSAKKRAVEKRDLLDPGILIEDELLLALPQIPRHSEAGLGTDCDVQFDYPVNEEVKEALEYEMTQEDDNPFAVLKQLKNTDTN